MRSLLTLLLIVLALTACSGRGSQEEPVSPGPDPGGRIGEATLTGIYEEPITLHDGKWEGEPLFEGGAARPRVWWLPRIVHQGDLDGDGRPDGLAWFGENSGGTGEFLYLGWLVPSGEGKPPHSRAVYRVGDRVQIIRSTLEEGQLRVRLIAAGPTDGACCPTQIEERRYTFHEGSIQEEVEVVGQANLAEIVGTTWVLQRMGFDGEPIEGDAPRLRIEGDQIEGFGGCNSYHGAVTPGEGKDLTIGPLAMTRKACPGPAGEIEDRYMEALRGANRWGFMMGQLTLSTMIDGEYALLFFDAAP